MSILYAKLASFPPSIVSDAEGLLAVLDRHTTSNKSAWAAAEAAESVDVASSGATRQDDDSSPSKRRCVNSTSDSS